MNPNTCPPEHIVFDEIRGEYVCTLTGEVVEDAVIDTGPEWRSFTEEDRLRRSRVGAPRTALVHDYGLTTYIRPQRRGDPRQYKLAALQASLRTRGQKRLIEVLREVNKAAARLHLPARVAETAAILLRRLESMGLIKKNNMAEYVAAAVYVAAKMERHPVPLQEVIDALGVDRQAIWRATINIYNKLKVTRSRAPKPVEFVPRLASKLNLSPEVEMLASRFAHLLQETGLAQGKPPMVLAAASLYLASILLDEKRNQTEIARAVGVTDATIRNRYRDIVDHFYIEVRL
ncbi:MAG: transcription initiation factor IIB family protein [Crenarchaeota archaeon]|nr:transcription initiation factor IIB family protein [Thermoproteota archaeon]